MSPGTTPTGRVQTRAPVAGDRVKPTSLEGEGGIRPEPGGTVCPARADPSIRIKAPIRQL